MKSSKAIKIIIIGLILAVIILVFYYHISNTARSKSEEEVQPTVVQNVLMKDLERSYPPSPKEVLKYYSEITKCFYNEEYTEEELEALAMKIQELYDEELIANKSREDYLKDLHSEIADMKQSKYTIYSYEISASTDVEYFTENDYSCARLYCTYNLKQAGSSGVTASVEQFVLRQDEDGHWKILGWELVND